MPAGKMHADEVQTDAALVRRLLASQFPRWADLPIERVRSAGTDNAIYRLGDRLAVRLPRIAWAAPQARKEQRWLATLAPHLPLAIPVPLALGRPGEGYPWDWSVCPWLAGDDANGARIDDPLRAAEDLARFVTALHRIDPTGGPPAGEHNFFRGVPLSARDAPTRAAIGALHDAIDARAASAAWDAALAAPAWDRPPVWTHGDLQPGNLLVTHGQLTAVIDFGSLGVGDPACDLMPAWNFLPPESRDAFRAALAVDEPTWSRGRGWALSVALIALPYYRHSNPVLADTARRAIAEVLSAPAPAARPPRALEIPSDP